MSDNRDRTPRGDNRAPCTGHKARDVFCITCGTQFAATADGPSRCPICEDARQYVPAAGQKWISSSDLQLEHRNAFQYEAPDLLGIGTTPSFAIGQRALLIRSASGNVLWDCVSLMDTATRDLITALGGVSAIAISHPHYYSGMVDWSRAFGGAPIYLHEADRQWVMRPDPAIRFWSGERFALADGITLIRCGGHFTGAAVLHWSAGAGGLGALLSGDVVQVIPDPRHVSFMYSYPNLIPLPAAQVEQIVATLEPFAFEELYGAWWGRVVRGDAHGVVRESGRRYIDALAGTNSL